MAKKVKKAVKKRAAVATRKRPHHPWDHHDLLLIVAGAFIVIVLVMLFSGNSVSSMFMNTQTSASNEGVMEKENEQQVTIQDFSFGPETLTVKAGTVVTWTNNDAVAHSATADDGSFDTGLLEKGQSGSVTLNEPGEYTYHCSMHPNMTGKIIVE